MEIGGGGGGGRSKNFNLDVFLFGELPDRSFVLGK